MLFSFFVNGAHFFLGAVATRPVGNMRLEIGGHRMARMTHLDAGGTHPVDAALFT